MTSKTLPTLRPDQRLWLLATVLTTLLPQAGQLPQLVTAFNALLVLWSASLLFQQRGMPPRVLLTGLGVGGLALVFSQYQTLIGKEPGLAILSSLLALKLLETHDRRDARAVILLGFFLQLGLFFYNQAMWIAGLALVATCTTFAGMHSLESPPRPAPARLTGAARLVLQGIPLMVVLFLLFPRIQGPLWGIPDAALGSTTGLSDRMEPGALSRLSESDEIAFRAKFEGPLPPERERYWRGPVLSKFDGHTWRPGPEQILTQPFYTPAGQEYRYTLTLEPHDQRWLLALDYPGGDSGQLYSSTLALQAREPVHKRLALPLTAYPHARPNRELALVLGATLELPPNSNPRAQALGRSLRQRAQRHSDIPALAIQYLREQKFRYTLDPPPLDVDDVDSFLFDTRAGYCEQFSGAFVVLMRAAGLSARVVTGYQGGEFNPVDGTLVVRQMDAHAWAEVWLPDRGWVRVDPTAEAAPARLTESSRAALAPNAKPPLLARVDMAWLRDLRNQFDALNHRWNQWVLGYNPGRQRDFLELLGFDNPTLQNLTSLMAALTLVVLGGLSLWALRTPPQGDALDRAWQQVCQQLGRLGLARASWEGPRDYTRRVLATRPDLAPLLEPLATEYLRLRYGPEPLTSGSLRRFLQSARKFRPR